MKITLTEQELNEAYIKIHQYYKEGFFRRANTVSIPFKDTQLIFAFDPNLGAKGNWLIISDVDVIEAE